MQVCGILWIIEEESFQILVDICKTPSLIQLHIKYIKMNKIK